MIEGLNIAVRLGTVYGPHDTPHLLFKPKVTEFEPMSLASRYESDCHKPTDA